MAKSRFKGSRVRFLARPNTNASTVSYILDLSLPWDCIITTSTLEKKTKNRALLITRFTSVAVG